MRAALCTEYGSHDKLIVSDEPDPIPEPGQVLIDVHAASLNFADLLVIRGEYQFNARHPGGVPVQTRAAVRSRS